MLQIRNPWIFLIIGFVLIGISVLEFEAISLLYPSIIAFVMSLYFVSRNFEQPKEVTHTTVQEEEDESLTILKKRYAKKEITKEEFDHMKRELEYLEGEREKKGYSVEELNKINELRWKKNNPVEKEFQKQIQEEIQALRKANGDEDKMEQIMLNHGFKGKNIDENGEPYWVCSHCSDKFNTREDYITHHFQVHS